MNRIIAKICAGAILATSLGTGAMAAPRVSADTGFERPHLIEVQRRGCSARQALNKAERLGLRRVRVVRERRNTISVSGIRRGDRVVVTFLRDRRCTIA